MIWAIWHNRNKILHGKQGRYADDNLAWENMLRMSVASRIKIKMVPPGEVLMNSARVIRRWKRPGMGIVKINTDAELVWA